MNQTELQANRVLRLVLLLVFVVLLSSGVFTQWNQTSVRGPRGSNGFGAQVVLLSNGNYFVSDPAFDPGTGPGTGGVFLYDGATNKLISRIVGSRPTDRVGSGGIYEIANDRVVVSSPEWNGTAGAATWVDNVGGVFATVDAKNSIVGKYPGSRVSDYGIFMLYNGNYVVLSPDWFDGGKTNLGAVTWGDNTRPTTGYVSYLNSLVGSSQGDRVGVRAIAALRNGNYVVRSPLWYNRGAAAAGAATWGDGSRGTSGRVSPSNSIVGTSAGDRVGDGVLGLTNSNYIVVSPQWANQGAARAGAVTWGNGNGGTVGPVDAGNSIVGSTMDDQVGTRVLGLLNGDFIVVAPNWDDQSSRYADVGAVTWGKGTGGVTGPVSVNNSKIGSNAKDRVGSGAAIVLQSGHYAFASPYWNKERGAVTWGDAGGGTSQGYVDQKNSMVGGNGGDHVGIGGLVALSGGHYAFASPDWDYGVFASDLGAVTWGDGFNGSTGIVDKSNSLIGETAGDKVGSRGITPLRSGNYVALSPSWNNNGEAAAGAATFVPGGGPFSGVVSTSNSIYGTTAGDRVGDGGAMTLNQNYAVSSPYWASRGVNSDGIGAITWGDGVNGTSGNVSAGNSLTGRTFGDRVGLGARSTSAFSSGNGGFTALLGGDLAVASPYWASGGVNANGVGAVTRFAANAPTVGVVDASNSLVGNVAGDLVGACGIGCWAINALQQGQYSVYSSFWDNGTIIDAGAVTLDDGGGSAVGTITTSNSVVGRVSAPTSAGPLLYAYPWLNQNGRLLVGAPLENRIYLIGP